MRSANATQIHLYRLFNAIADRVVAALMRSAWWTPLGARLMIVIDGSDDVSLCRVRRDAVIRGYDVDVSGALTRLLVQLDSPLHYSSQHAAARREVVTENEIEWLVAEPRLDMPLASRLLFFCWWDARIVDAPSFADSTGRRPIGVARLRRRWNK